MAKRVNKPNHDAKTKRLIAASQLINRLISHANGELEMTATQINAAKIVINKAIPDLKAIEHSGPQGAVLQVGIVNFSDIATAQSEHKE